MKRTTTHRKNLIAGFETLETRQHMSVSPYVVSGTNANDVIDVSYGLQPALVLTRSLTSTPTVASTTGPTAGSLLSTRLIKDFSIFNQLTVTVNGVKSYPTLAAGQTIEVNALGGNDRITVSGIGVTINGGAGDDVIVTGSNNDTVSGGPGVDVVDYSSRSAGVTVKIDGYANDGQAGETDNILTDIEVVKGGWGNDNLWGNSADTVFRSFFGNYGDDVIVGGAGSDTIRGGAGNDTLIGNGGNDILFADSGNDSLYGGDGNDRIYGGTGADFIRAGNGDDLIVTIGGGQSDVIYGDAGTDSFWLDSESTERITDAVAAEAKNTHRVARYETLKIRGTVVGTPSREMNIGNLPDPEAKIGTTTYAYKNFADTPLFRNGTPLGTDVDQGAVGDCYFMAPLSAIARTAPSVIRQSVVDLGDGTFAVKMRRDGVAKFIRVDADLPVNSAGRPVFAGVASSNGSIWVPIMEKAWAWFRNSTGTYAGIDGGWPFEVFRTLGMSNSEYDPYAWFNDSPQEFGNKLADLLAQGKAVTLCTDDGGSIIGLHCYSVERVNKIGGTVTSIVLRNPHATDGKNPNADGVNDGFITLTAAQGLAAANVIQYGNA